VVALQMSSTLLTPRELAKLRQRSECTLARERQKGRGPKFIKDFGRIFYPEDEWEAWLARRPRYQSTSEYGGGNPGSTSPTSGRSQVQRVPVATAEGKQGPSPTRDSPAAPADGERPKPASKRSA